MMIGGKIEVETKRLFRSEQSKMIAGVCGGLSRYLGIDVSVIRLLWALWGLTGMGVIVYIIAVLVIPLEEY